MKELHPDFLTCSTEQSEKIQWSKRLFELATQKGSQSDSHSIDFEVPCHLLQRHGDNNRHDEIPAVDRIQVECTLRSLYPTEIVTLETTCRCKCNDWSKIRLLQESTRNKDEVGDLSQQLTMLISDTRLDGTIVLIFDIAGSNETQSKEETDHHTPTGRTLLDRMIPVGIHGCTVISNSMIHIATSKVYNCNLISHTYIDSSSIVMNCTYMAMSSPDQNDDDNLRTVPIVDSLSISVGAESGGGRTLRLLPESTMIHVSQQIVHSQQLSSSKTTQQQSVNIDDDHSLTFNIIGSYCVVRDTPTLFGVYLHSKTSIIAATHIEQVLLYPGSKICNACTVRNAILQWNCTITDYSHISDVFLMEEAMAGPQSMITNTVLGPDVHVSCGEVHASILGPNTNAHHQSLLIATIWMCGRGNVGYGSNVGSNHTGRIPDQECCAGEGIFWGLSCVIKFPVDLSCAPYTIIAAGTTLLPQRCTMPFSLIVHNNEGGSDILPGWVMRYSPYTIVRSEQKFAQRRKAIRHLGYTGWNIIRPAIIHLCDLARRQLVMVTTSNIKVVNDEYTVYSERIIPGIGANRLTEKGRSIGVQAYSELIQRFALQGLYMFLLEACEICSSSSNVSLSDIATNEFNAMDRLQSRDKAESVTPTEWLPLPWEDNDQITLWQSQRYYLLQEFPLKLEQTISEWIIDSLREYIILESAYVDRVRQCKQRDDSRGTEIIPGYNESHVLVEQDGVVFSVQKEHEERMHNVALLLPKLYDKL